MLQVCTEKESSPGSRDTFMTSSREPHHKGHPTEASIPVQVLSARFFLADSDIEVDF
jgi:hypothetical protein